jgi:hypothetical protein
LALRIVKSNASGFPVPAIPSRYNDPEGTGAPVNTLEGVYENGSTFSVDIAIQEEVIVESSIAYIDVPVTSVTASNLPSGITVSKFTDKIRISGSPFSVFTDSFYQFVMKDRSLKILPVDTTEPVLAIVRWSPPSTKIAYDVPYTINLKYMSSGVSSVEVSETITILQDIYWNYGVAVTGFRNALAKGTI